MFKILHNGKVLASFEYEYKAYNYLRYLQDKYLNAIFIMEVE